MIVWLVDIIVVISLAWFVVYGFGTQIRITGQSMTPELRSEDVVLMNRLSYDLGSPKRFDVVVFERDDKKPNVKRVIGLPGEVVEIKDGKVYIDGSPTPLDDSFIPEKMIGSYGPYTVPENCYFMLGDNRNDSKDSRSWKNKFVRFDQIVGKAVVRYYPSFKWLG